MPRFHFDIGEDGLFIRDDEGREFESAASAAVAAGIAMARDAFIAGSADHVVIDVREGDAPVMKISITLEVKEPVK